MKKLSRGPQAPLPIVGYRKNGSPIYPIAGAEGTGNPVLDRLVDERAKQIDLMDGILRSVDEEKRDLVDAEKNNLKAIKERIAQLDDQIKPIQEFESVRSSAVEVTRSTGSAQRVAADEGRMAARTSSRGEHQYRSAGQFLADMWVAQNRNDDAARERLASHDIRFEGGMAVRASAPHTTTAETPGLLPTQIVGEIMKNIDAARPFLSSIGVKDLGSIPGTSFKRPIVTESVKVGKQSAEKTEVEDGQFKVGSVNFTKETFGGWTNVSRQDIDWTSPGVWDALLTDFQEIYGLETEEAAVTAFNTAVTQATDVIVADADNPTVQDYMKALYAGAALAYGGAKRLPTHIWASLDMWASMGPLIDGLKATTGGNGGGDSSINSFAGNLLQVPRIIVPSLPEGTLIVGVASRTEAYEDRIGFLSAVQPRVLGVELAYGGYLATGTLTPTAFAKVTFEEAAG